MSSLVEELQRDALNSDSRLSDLLRKAKTIAVKLDLPEFEKWIENELNGYPPGDVPTYRIVTGQIQGKNPFYGWRPVIFKSSETERAFTKRFVPQKVSELENVVANSGSGSDLQIPLPAEAKVHFMQVTGFDLEFTLMVPVSAAVGILDAVRNALLDWTLKLEKLGVKGEGMSFSSDERKIARESPAVYHIESIGTFTGNMGSGSGNFVVKGNTVNAESKDAIEALVEKIRANESQLGLADAPAKELHQTIDGIQQEINSKKPSPSRVNELLGTIRNIAEGAVGSLAAQGILYELSKLVK